MNLKLDLKDEQSVARQRNSVLLNHFLCWEVHRYLWQPQVTTRAASAQASFTQFSTCVRLRAKHYTILLELNGLQLPGLESQLYLL